MNICDKLKQARLAKNMTQEAVAEKVGVSRQTMSNWENGKNYPDIASVIILSDIYGLTLDSLLRGDDKVFRHRKGSSNIVRKDISEGGNNMLNRLIGFVLLFVGIVAFIIIAGGMNIGYLMQFVDAPFIMVMGIAIGAMLTFMGEEASFVKGLKILFKQNYEVSKDELKSVAATYELLKKTVVCAAVLSTTMQGMLFAGQWHSLPGDTLTVETALALTFFLPTFYAAVLIMVFINPTIHVCKKHIVVCESSEPEQEIAKERPVAVMQSFS